MEYLINIWFDSIYTVHGMPNINNLVLVILGRVKENVYTNHTLCWMLSTISGMSSSLVVIIMSGRSDEMVTEVH